MTWFNYLGFVFIASLIILLNVSPTKAGENPASSDAGSHHLEAAIEWPIVYLSKSGIDWPIVYPSKSAIDWPVVTLSAAINWPVVYPEDSISILLAGDTGFGGHGQPVYAGRGLRHGRQLPYATMTEGISGLLTGDAAFANLETVITDHNRLRAKDKRFVFRSHPSAIRHLYDLGFNLFSTSNNHVGDYGGAGIRETLDHLDDMHREGLQFAAAGLGHDREAALTPQKLRVKNVDLYLSAIGIGGGHTNAAGKPARRGQLSYGKRQDFEDVVRKLGATKSGYRMLSVHYGEERQVYPAHRDVRRLRDQAVLEQGIDLVIGHHAHVPRGIQIINGKLIFYGLGNFLHPGMQDMARFDRCRDFGVVARVHLGRSGAGRYRAMAVEVIPVTNMHATPRPMRLAAARVRIRVLNGLARGLDSPDVGARGLRFVVQSDGRGVACLAGAEDMKGAIGRLCIAVKDAARAGAVSVEPEPVIACRAHSSVSYKAKSSKRRRRRKKPDYFNPFGF